MKYKVPKFVAPYPVLLFEDLSLLVLVDFSLCCL